MLKVMSSTIIQRCPCQYCAPCRRCDALFPRNRHICMHAYCMAQRSLAPSDPPTSRPREGCCMQCRSTEASR